MLSGVGLALFDVWWQTALAQRIPPYALSRVSSYDWMGSLALLPLGYLLAGPAAEAFGASEVLIVGGLVGLAISALGFAIPDVWRLRKLSRSRVSGRAVVRIGSASDSCRPTARGRARAALQRTRARRPDDLLRAGHGRRADRELRADRRHRRHSAARCDTLRAAVAAANANAGGVEETDVIFLQAAGTYQLTQPSELALTDEVSIVGRGPRTTAVAGNGSTRVFSVSFGVTAALTRLAVVGGDAPSGDGGNILNAGSLLLTQVRVSGGAAQAGGGIANYHQLSINGSLVENNEATSNGGGMLNRGIDAEASITMLNSTIALNRAGSNGAGIASLGSSQNSILLSHATIARNQITTTGTGAGIYAAATGEQVLAAGSIVAENSGGDATNCGGPGTFAETNAGSNVTNPGSGDCNFDLTGTIGLAGTLSDQGGDTDVLTIDPLLLAKNAVAPCFMPTDQRNAPRPSGTCDAGAFQEGAVAPPIDSGPRAGTGRPAAGHHADARAAGPNATRPRRNRRPSSASPWSSSLCGEPCSSARGGRRSARRCAPARRSRSARPSTHARAASS